MPTYLLSFRTPGDYVPTLDTRARWNAFFDSISSHIEDLGAPIFSRRSVGETGPETVLGGYSLIDADSLDQAIALAQSCPLVDHGGGVDVGELTDPSVMPATP